MSAHKIKSDLKAARKSRTKNLTAATTLTVKDLLTYDVIRVGNYAATLPTPCAALEGVETRFIATAAATVVGVAASKAEAVTLAEGDLCITYCNGTYFYSLGPTTAG
jgi:hypothetical protein